MFALSVASCQSLYCQVFVNSVLCSGRSRVCKVDWSELTSGVGRPGSRFLVPCICMLERSLSSSITRDNVWFGCFIMFFEKCRQDDNVKENNFSVLDFCNDFKILPGRQCRGGRSPATCKSDLMSFDTFASEGKYYCHLLVSVLLTHSPQFLFQPPTARSRYSPCCYL